MRALTSLALGLAMLFGAPDKEEASEANLEFHKGVPSSDLKIKMSPAATMTGKKPIVLSLKIANESEEEIKTALAHEWHGGIWPPTDIYASVTPEKEKKIRPFHPVYLVGEDQNVTRKTTLAPGKTTLVNLRMDWPGTGSVKTDPLVSAPGKYAVRLALVFEVSGKQQYVITSPEIIELPAK